VAIISVNRNGSTTTGHSGWLAGGKETVGTNAAAFSFCATRSGRLYIYGMYCEGNNGASASNLVTVNPSSGSNVDIVFVSCTLATPGTSGSAEIAFGQATNFARFCRVRCKDCTFIAHNSTSANLAVFVVNGATVFISNLTVSYTSAKPPLLMRGGSNGAYVEIVDSDLSGFNSGTYISVANLQMGKWDLKNCKLHATPAILTGTWPTNNMGSVTLINVDSADTYRGFAFYNRLGTLVSNESIYANDGATIDSTHFGWDILTTSACNEFEPFITPWMTKWLSSTSALTPSIELNHDSATALHDRNCWGEFEYVSSSSFTIGTLSSTRNSQPFDGSSSNLSSGSATWTGTGGFSNANPQKITWSFTPAEKSAARVRLSIGIASKRLYVDPSIRT
jgi:hypothetical protein